MAHVGQQHTGQPRRWQHDTDESQHVRVVQTAHEQPLAQEGFYLLHLRNACGVAGVRLGPGRPSARVRWGNGEERSPAPGHSTKWEHSGDGDPPGLFPTYDSAT